MTTDGAVVRDSGRLRRWFKECASELILLAFFLPAIVYCVGGIAYGIYQDSQPKTYTVTISGEDAQRLADFLGGNG